MASQEIGWLKISPKNTNRIKSKLWKIPNNSIWYSRSGSFQHFTARYYWGKKWMRTGETTLPNYNLSGCSTGIKLLSQSFNWQIGERMEKLDISGFLLKYTISSPICTAGEWCKNSYCLLSACKIYIILRLHLITFGGINFCKFM